ALEGEAVSLPQPELLSANPKIEGPRQHQPGLRSVVTVIAAVCTGLDRAHQHLERSGQVGRKKLLRDPESGEREPAAILLADDDVPLLGRTADVDLEEPVHVHAEHVADLLQDADRQLGLVALDLAEIADRYSGLVRHLLQSEALDLAQLADLPPDLRLRVDSAGGRPCRQPI